MPKRPETLVVEPTPAPTQYFSPADPIWSFAGLPMPIIYEDERQEEMGEALGHTRADHVLTAGIEAHLGPQSPLAVCSNLNCQYDSDDPAAYFSPDVMVVKPAKRLADTLSSYRIGKHGPAPILIIEILSRRSYQQRDLLEKPILYGRLHVPEYILVDVTGQFLPRRLELRRCRADSKWTAEQDGDGGVTSKLGFRIIIEPDDNLRVLDAKSGKRYFRPDEAQAVCDAAQEAQRQADDRVRELEAELKRLRKRKPKA